tara:strand:+ start:29 stop:316 length:288 start_codon:yes stop_codon:yes gene_type:complete
MPIRDKTPQNRVTRGVRAQEILDDPVFKEMIQELREGLFTRWTNTDSENLSTRENIFSVFNAIGEIEMQLQSIANDGQINQKQFDKHLRRKRSAA